MAFLTCNELILKPCEGAPVVNETLKRTLDRLLPEKRVFLFYRLADKDKLTSVVNILKSLRLNIYIDFIEPSQLAEHPSELLTIIKSRLRQAEKALLLATPQNTGQNGYPLDYGLNGKFRNTRKVLTFPVTDDPHFWPDKDKFRMYGMIQKKYTLFNFQDDWQVVFPEGDKTSLKEWLLK